MHYTNLESYYNNLVKNPLLNEENKLKIDELYNSAREYVKTLLQQVETSLNNCNEARTKSKGKVKVTKR